MGLIQNIKLFIAFRRAIRNKKVELLNKFNLRIDYANRLYTVLNIPESIFGEAYVFKKEEISKISEVHIKNYVSDVGKTLSTYGINELFNIYKIERVDKLSYLVVIGFSLFKSTRFYNIIYYILLPFLLIFITTISYLFL